jgi:hypothetical protein
MSESISFWSDEIDLKLEWLYYTLNIVTTK